MATKRNFENIEVTVKSNKKMKNSAVPVSTTKNFDTTLSDKLPEDVLIESWEIDEMCRMTLKYDQVFGALFLTITKSVKDGGEKAITLSDEEMAKLESVGANILELSQRYLGSGRNINFVFNLCSLLKVKLDFGGFGSVDIRRYFLTPDETEAPTRNGVRISEKSFSSLFDTLKSVMKIVRDMTEKTVNVVKKCKLALMVREIAELDKTSRLNVQCEACQIGDPSQDHHDCLTIISNDWAESVNMYSKVVEKTVKHQEIVQLAEKVGRKMNVVLLDAESKIRDDPSDKLFMGDEKNFVQDKLFAICAKLCAEQNME